MLSPSSRATSSGRMGFAVAAGVPVILAGDIDRGGVIAQIVGARAVLPDADAAMIRGFLVNKFRGDARLFDDGYRMIEERSGWRGFVSAKKSRQSAGSSRARRAERVDASTDPRT